MNYKIENKNILIVSNEPWGEIWFSKHNYAYELSKRNNKVFFINPSPKWRFSNLFKSNIDIKEEMPNLFRVSYHNFLPSRFLKINNSIVSKRLRKILFQKGVKETLFWSFDPYRLYDPQLLNANLSFFHAVDRYLFIHPAEKLLYNNVDAILSISHSFNESFSEFEKPILTLPHGISSEEFKIEDNSGEKIELNNYGLYVGNLDERLDLDLIEKMLQSFSDTPFLFVGKYNYHNKNTQAEKIFIEKKHSNLHFIGPRKFKKLKYFIANAKFCIAPMEKDHPGNTISHHKIFQYMAFGKPCFSIEFSEYKNNCDHLLYMENNANQLIEMMKKYMVEGEKKAMKNERIAFASQYQYENLFDQIDEFIETSL